MISRSIQDCLALSLWAALVAACGPAPDGGEQPAEKVAPCADPRTDRDRAACAALAAVVQRGGSPSSRIASVSQDSAGYCVMTGPGGEGLVLDGAAAVRVSASGVVLYVALMDSAMDCSAYEKRYPDRIPHTNAGEPVVDGLLPREQD